MSASLVRFDNFLLRETSRRPSLVAAAFAACGSPTRPTSAPASTHVVSTTTTTTTTAPSIAKESAKFLALVGPYNSAVAAHKTSPTNITITAQLQAEAAPLVAASQTFDNALLRAGFTGQVAADARKFATDDAAVIADLQGWTMETLTQGETALVHDEGVVNGDDNVLRSDLGLPPSS